MARLLEQRNLSLTPEQWLGLELAAEQTNSRATRGTGAHQPAWRTLIRRIAEGDVLVQERQPYRMPDGLAEQAAAVEERQREREQDQERQRQLLYQELERRRRVEQHTAHKQAERKTPVKLTQLSMLDLEPA